MLIHGWRYRTGLFLKLSLFASTEKKIRYHTIVNTASPELEGSRAKCSWEDVKMAVLHTTGARTAPGSFAV